VSLPEFILSVDAPDFELTLPETASAYISNGKSVVQIQTKGKKARKPIKFTETSVTSSDPGTTVTLAANNFATQVTADTTVINFDETKIVVDATVNGETSTVSANEAAPQVIVTTDTGAVVTTTNNVNLSKVEAVVTEELVPTAVKPGLAPLAEREAAAPEVTTTTAAATTTTVAAVATTVVASDPKPTTTPTAAALSAVPTAPANSPLRNDVSFTVGDPINITIPNVRPGVWLQLILSSPTRVLQTVQANSAGKVVFKTTIPLDTKVSTSALRPTSVANNLFYDLIIYSNVYKEYNQQTKIEIGPVLKTDSSPSATTTTTTVATTTTTVATTTTTVAATTTTTVAPTTTTTVPTYALTVSGAGMGSVTGNITMNPSSGTTKTCSSLSTSCVHSFPAGVTVAISFTIPETSAFVFWTPSGFGGTVGSPPCPAQGDTGGEIRPSNPGYLSSSVGTLTCSYTMTAANKALGYYVSG
jgi:hypothetical protein